MAADQEPKIADDGVQEVALTIARPLLTRLIEQALEENQVSALTVRSRRRAYLVKPAFYDQALSDRRMVEAFFRAAADIPNDADSQTLIQTMGRLLSESDDRDNAAALNIAAGPIGRRVVRRRRPPPSD